MQGVGTFHGTIQHLERCYWGSIALIRPFARKNFKIRSPGLSLNVTTAADIRPLTHRSRAGLGPIAGPTHTSSARFA